MVKITKEEIFIENLSNKIKISELEDYLKSILQIFRLNSVF